MGKIDFNKPVQTKDGKYVTILTSDGPDASFPVVGYVEGRKAVLTWDMDGVPKTGGTKWELEQAPDYERYSISLTEGEGGRGADIAKVIVDPENKTIAVRPKNGWKVEGQNINRPDTKREEATPAEAAGGLANLFYNDVLMGKY